MENWKFWDIYFLSDFLDISSREVYDLTLQGHNTNPYFGKSAGEFTRVSK